MGNTTFKKATASDTNYIITIARKTVDRIYRNFLEDYAVDQYLNNKHFEDYLESNIANTWVLRVKHNIVGFAICIENVIDFMMIDVEHQRQGFGTALLQYCEALLFDNHKVIALESFEENINANKFYLANHWIKTEKYRDPKPNAVKIIYRKKLYSSAEHLRMNALGTY